MIINSQKNKALFKGVRLLPTVAFVFAQRGAAIEDGQQNPDSADQM